MPTAQVDAYSARYGEALAYAARIHAGQTRKGTQIPYISHLMAVSALVWEADGDEDQAIAGLLHDAAEDQGGEAVLSEIQSMFGASVAEQVRICSDSLTEDPNQKDDWFERKQHHLDVLRQCPPAQLLVPAADKVHNCSAIVWDVDHHGPEVWKRFNRGPAEVSWYYLNNLQLLKQKRPDCTLTDRLKHWVNHLLLRAADA